MATEKQIQRWLSPGVEIKVEEPTPEQPLFVATAPEFGLHVEGKTIDDCYSAIVDAIVKHANSFLGRNKVLPDRTEWLTRLPGQGQRANDGSD